MASKKVGSMGPHRPAGLRALEHGDELAAQQESGHLLTQGAALGRPVGARAEAVGGRLGGQQPAHGALHALQVARG